MTDGYIGIPMSYFPEGVGPGTLDPKVMRAAAEAYQRGFDHNMEIKSWVVLYFLDGLERERLLEAELAATKQALGETAVILQRIPWKPEYAGEVTANLYMALSRIEDGLGLEGDERGTAPGQYDRDALAAAEAPQ